jgi:hypothetical protein
VVTGQGPEGDLADYRGLVCTEPRSALTLGFAPALPGLLPALDRPALSHSLDAVPPSFDVPLASGVAVGLAVSAGVVVSGLSQPVPGLASSWADLLG